MDSSLDLCANFLAQKQSKNSLKATIFELIREVAVSGEIAHVAARGLVVLASTDTCRPQKFTAHS
jgi:hypothetical protein